MKYDNEFFCKAKANGVKEITIPFKSVAEYILFRYKMADIAGVYYNPNEIPQNYMGIKINLVNS